MASRKASAAAFKDIAMASSYFGTATSVLVGPQSAASVFDHIVGLGSSLALDMKPRT
jgi:hypothetical protein